MSVIQMIVGYTGYIPLKEQKLVTLKRTTNYDNERNAICKVISVKRLCEAGERGRWSFRYAL